MSVVGNKAFSHRRLILLERIWLNRKDHDLLIDGGGEHERTSLLERCVFWRASERLLCDRQGDEKASGLLSIVGLAISDRPVASIDSILADAVSPKGTSIGRFLASFQCIDAINSLLDALVRKQERDCRDSP